MLRKGWGKCMGDIYETEKKYEKYFKEIDEWPTSESNKQKIREFLEKMKLNGISVVQLLKYAITLKQFIQVCNKEFAEVSKEDIDKFMLSLRGRKTKGKKEIGPCKVKTRKIKYYCLKKFFDWLGMKELFKNNSYRFTLKKDSLPQILTKEEIRKLINACDNVRDRAFIACLYESGARIGEFLKLRIKDIEFDEFGAILTVSGKTGARRIRLIEYANLLKNWISLHPTKEDKESYVWIKKSYASIRKFFERLRKKAKIDKPLHPHLLRHSRATHLAKHMTEAELCEFFGWTKSSNMPAIYVHLSGRDLDDKLFKIYGLENGKQEMMEEEIKKCPRCQEINPAMFNYCSKCGFPLNEKELMRADKTIELTVKFLRILSERMPEIKEEFRKLVKQEKLEHLFLGGL